jgi:hypothetical protein
MHNNGTSRLILPQRGNLLPDLNPQSGIRLSVSQQGIVVTPYVGDKEMSITINPQMAAQMGVNLISFSALVQQAAQQAAQAGPMVISTEVPPEAPPEAPTEAPAETDVVDYCDLAPEVSTTEPTPEAAPEVAPDSIDEPKPEGVGFIIRN